MLLEELHYEGPMSIEELDTWGILPILDQLKRFDEYCQPSMSEALAGEREDPGLTYFYFELRHKVERLQKTIYRLFREAMGEKEAPADQVMNLIREVGPETRKGIKKRLEEVYLKGVPEQEEVES